MNFLRSLLSWLVLALIVLVALAGAAFTPYGQTWVAQWGLDRHPDYQASVGSFFAGFGRVSVEDLNFDFKGGTVKVPSLEAKFPIIKAVRSRDLRIEKLVAKGWTIDLTPAALRRNGRASGITKAEATQATAAVFSGILTGGKLPDDLALDGVDLEGDVIGAALPGTGPNRIHVIIRGGGLASGREGTFVIDAAVAAAGEASAPNLATARGKLTAAMDSPRTFNRLEFKGEVSDNTGVLPPGIVLTADAAAVREANGETYALDLESGNRQVVSLSARLPEATQRWAGTWKIDLRDGDLKPLIHNRPLPSLTANGSGQFDADRAFARVHAAGDLNASVGQLGLLAPALEHLGPAKLTARFDLTRGGSSIRVDRLDLSFDGTSQSHATAKALQPFDLDEKTGDLKLSDAASDCLEGSIRAFPLALLSKPGNPFGFAAGTAAGDFAIRASDGKFSLRSKGFLSAKAVSLQKGGKILVEGLDVSTSVLVDCSAQGWQAQGDPLTVSRGGRQLATLSTKMSRPPGDDQAVTVSGTWSADLDALATLPILSGTHWIAGRSTTGDFSLTVGSSGAPLGVQSKLSVIGHDPGHSLTGTADADIGADGAVSFLVPIKIAFGSSISDVRAEGKWRDTETGPQVEVRLAGTSVLAEHLLLLAALFTAAGDASSPCHEKGGIPFWGNSTGQIVAAFDHLKSGAREFEDVVGTLDFDPRSLRLQNGHGGLPHHSPATLEGTITFDAAAAAPYGLKATGTLDDIDAASLFATPPRKGEALLEGKFSVTDNLTGKGAALDDLVSQAQHELHFTSAATGGIIRLLATDVTAAIPEVSTPVADAMGSVGSAVNLLMGIKKEPASSKNILSKPADAVLNFTYAIAEIGYDKLTATAITGPDGTIRIADIEITGSDEHLKGTGQIAFAAGKPLSARPLGLDLQVGLRGMLAGLLVNAPGVVSARKDSLGYAMVEQPLHFGGTLEHIDPVQWHDLLAKAATQKPAAPSKRAP